MAGIYGEYVYNNAARQRNYLRQNLIQQSEVNWINRELNDNPSGRLYTGAAIGTRLGGYQYQLGAQEAGSLR